MEYEGNAGRFYKRNGIRINLSGKQGNRFFNGKKFNHLNFQGKKLIQFYFRLISEFNPGMFSFSFRSSHINPFLYLIIDQYSIKMNHEGEHEG